MKELMDEILKRAIIEATPETIETMEEIFLDEFLFMGHRAMKKLSSTHIIKHMEEL